MRVLLIEPPTNCFTGLVRRGYPVGLCSLAAAAKKAGLAAVSVYDVDRAMPSMDGLNFTDQRSNMGRFLDAVNNAAHPVWREIASTLATLQPDAVGISTMTIQYASALQVARVVKDWNPTCPVIMGGAHASVMPRGMVEWPHTDIVVMGEGEEAFCEIIRRMKSGNRSVDDIPGVITKNTPQKFTDSPIEVRDIDDLPIPDRSALLHSEGYTPEDMGLLITSRGCPYQCSYCSNFSRKTRFRSVENVVDEITQVRATYGTKQFMFKDDAFTIRRERVTELCNAFLDRKIRILWESATRLDLIDVDLVRLMKKAGCNRIGVGIESGDEEMLLIYNKRLKKDQIRAGVEILDRCKVFWTGYFMMALPMEREEQVHKTLAFMKELSPPYAAVGVYKPYPGTKLFEIAADMGLVESDVPNEHFFHTNPVDYFLRDPHRRCVHIPEQKLDELISHVAQEFERSNKGLRNVIRRGLARRDLYLADYRSFIIDCKRAIKWLSS